jgi:hypothetical protein
MTVKENSISHRAAPGQALTRSDYMAGPQPVAQIGRRTRPAYYIPAEPAPTIQPRHRTRTGNVST